MSLSEADCFCDPMEETLATELVQTIAQSLNNASDTLSCSKLILPDCLLHSISQELLHLAESEPCGLRGALVDLCVDRGDQGSLCTVDQIAVDATLVPTFHVTLVLRLESNGLWPKVQKLFKSPQTSATPLKHRHTQKLSASFRAIKRKLYCSGELLIEECCWPSTSLPDKLNKSRVDCEKKHRMWKCNDKEGPEVDTNVLTRVSKVFLETTYVSWQLHT